MSDTYYWYQITTKEYIDNTKSQRVKFDVVLETLGAKTIEIIVNDYYSVLVDDVFIPIGLNGANPINKQDISAELTDDGIFWVGFKYDS